MPLLALLLGALLAVVTAFLFLRRVDPVSPVGRIAAESLILGPALPAMALFLMSLSGVAWSRGVMLGIGVAGIAVLVVLSRKGGLSDARSREPLRGGLDIVVAIPLLLLVALLLAGYAQFAYVSAGAENDFIGIWGAKGRTFFEAGRIDFEFLSAPWRGYAHPDYPLLVPLVFSAIAVTAGSWSESLLGLLYPLLAVGGLLLAHSEMRRRTSRVSIQWLAVLGVVPFVASPWIGLADGPLAMMVLAALIRLSRWLDDSGDENLTVGAVFLGLAMSTKNEGVALGVVAFVFLGWMTPRAERRRLVALWPAGLIALPWLVLRSIHGLSTDLFEAGASARLLGRAFDPGYLSALGRYLVQFRPGLWLPYLACVIALLVWRKRLGRGATFLVIVVAIQLAVDLGAYLVTPLPLEWHVRWSWERLVSQVGPAIAVATTALLVEVANGSDGRFATLVGSRPEVEDEQPDTDTDG